MLHRLLSIGATGVFAFVLTAYALPTGAPAASFQPSMPFPVAAEDSEEDQEEGEIEYWEEEEEEQPASGDGKDGDKKKKDKTLEEFVTDFDKLDDGLFTFYRNKKTGDLYMAVKADQFDREYIYISTIQDGVPAAISWRGFYRANAILTLRRHFDRVEFQFENTAYYFDPENELSRAKEANISPAFAYVDKVKATSEDQGTVLVPVTKLFVSQALDPVKLPIPGIFELGKLNGKKSKITDVRTYPENVDVITSLTFDNPKALAFDAPGGVTDPRYITIKLQNSIVAMPEAGFTARFDDQRVGYFTTEVTDLTSPEVAPYRDLIHRWRLVKKDPTAERSEPVEPIVFWIENTTPAEYRDTIKAATEAWNEAFEAAGFINAVQVKIQPDDADWDAADVRYHVLRWTSSPTPPFGGYGPSVVNPRTGEIIAADIMLEYVFVTNRAFYDRIFGPGESRGPLGALEQLLPERHAAVEAAVERIDALGPLADGDVIRDAVLAAQAESAAQSSLRGFDRGAIARQCQASFHIGLNTQLGLQMLAAQGATDPEKSALIKESLYYLTLHEVGHTLGLNHNMKATQLHPLADVHDKAKTQGIVAGSVMDYPAINLAPTGKEQGDYYNFRPGPYDLWAIEFGYSPDVDDTDNRATLLARSVEPALAFGNDADDMRSVGFGGIDPRVMIGDMSSDAVEYSMERLQLVDDTFTGLKDKLAQPGETWQATQQAYFLLNVAGRVSPALVMANYVGGVQVERFVAGQAGAEDLTPFTPVSKDEQKAALDALSKHIFAPDAISIDADLARHLQAQRRGFNFFGGTEDPKLHEFTLLIQDVALAQMMSPITMRRMVNARLYGNEYTSLEYLKDLTKAIFEEDAQTDVNTYRQNLQIRYITRLLVMVLLPFYDDVTQSAALQSLKEVRKMTTPKFFGIGQQVSEETKAHRAHVRLLLRSVGIL